MQRVRCKLPCVPAAHRVDPCSSHTAATRFTASTAQAHPRHHCARLRTTARWWQLPLAYPQPARHQLVVASAFARTGTVLVRTHTSTRSPHAPRGILLCRCHLLPHWQLARFKTANRKHDAHEYMIVQVAHIVKTQVQSSVRATARPSLSACCTHACTCTSAALSAGAQWCMPCSGDTDTTDSALHAMAHSTDCSCCPRGRKRGSQNTRHTSGLRTNTKRRMRTHDRLALRRARHSHTFTFLVHADTIAGMWGGQRPPCCQYAHAPLPNHARPVP
jgi:hypothetical protein